LLLLLLLESKSCTAASEEVSHLSWLLSLLPLLLLLPLSLLVAAWRTQPTWPHRQLLCVLQ
jgi:hypothetical protein